MIQERPEASAGMTWSGYGESSAAASDLEIQALADNELEEPRRTAVLNELSRNRQLRNRYEDLCHQRDLLRMWWSSAARVD